MMLFENISMALRSIAGNKLRSFLTMLGIIIGVGAVVAISGLGQGLKKVVTEEVANLGANAVIVVPGKVGIGSTSTSGSDAKKSGAKSSGTPNFASSLGTSTLTEQDVSSASNNPRILVAAPLSLISGIVANGEAQDAAALVIGTTPDFLEAYPTQKIDQGRFLQAGDSGKYNAVIGADTRDVLFGKDVKAVGKTLEIRGKTFTVVGVFKSSGGDNGFSQGPNFSDAVFFSTETAKQLTGSNTLQIFRILAQAKTKDDVKPAVESLTKSIKKNHGGQDDFSILTQDDILKTFDTILNALTTAISAIAGISLLVGGIGIMNIMLVSVTERTREIGLRKAIGATSGMVLSQFLIEAVVLTMLGGLLGLAFAYGLGMLIGRVANLTPVFTLNTIAIAFIVSAAVGIIFGIAPAIKAARKKPIDALRYE